MPMTMTLADLTARTGFEVLDHLELEMTIPITDGIQAQGDLIVIPHALVRNAITEGPFARWRDIPTTGMELLRSGAGGNPHSLVADPGICTWTTGIRDTTDLALGMLDTRVVAYLIHPEHGASAIAPGRYVIRRQRERGTQRLGRSLNHLIAD
ncbi:hypothetical protein OIE68_40820 [Nocardia vinacea]|uniref:Uncharacterized protein n=1 Tax=Nocardia vinacea TaxID=96468 RepID=A0ABZ1Z9Y0_9NOCA|nr:hypothetical protein OIE68_40820 [Nocardia vinacea]